MIHFFLLVNKFGQTRLAQYYDNIETKDRVAMEGEIVRKCVTRPDEKVNVSIYFLAAFERKVTLLSIFRYLSSHMENIRFSTRGTHRCLLLLEPLKMKFVLFYTACFLVLFV